MTRRHRRLGTLLALLALPLIALAPGDRADAADGKAAEVRFSHEVHAGRGVKIDDCGGCHVLGADGRAAPPTSKTPHQPCATAGCHAEQYWSRTPTICVVCHDDIDPSKKQPARLVRRERTEFGGEINHASHAGARVSGQGPNGACVACHGDPYKKAAAPEGHAVCAPCHGKSGAGGAAPTMQTCGGCHTRDAKGGGGGKPRSAWSVAATFDHGDHDKDPRKGASGAPTCTECHSTVAKATTIRAIKAPTMQTCDGCHDGKHAFKTTGFGCAKCHAKAR